MELKNLAPCDNYSKIKAISLLLRKNLAYVYPKNNFYLTVQTRP